MTSLSKPKAEDCIEPFGSPEGDVEDLGNFIRLSGTNIPSDIKKDMRDLSIKVLVGRKGAGKTYYKNIMQAAAVDWDSVLCVKPLISKLEPTIVKQFAADMRDTGEMSSIWQTLWRRAIFFSIASQIFCDQQFGLNKHSNIFPSIATVRREYLSAFREHVEKPFSKRISFNMPKCIYGAANQLCSVSHDIPSLIQEVMNDQWNALEVIMSDVLRALPPVVYFIDALDDDFRHAPSAYMDCQKGLYYATRDIYAHSDFNDRLHVTITLRDLVFSAAVQTEHRLKNVRNPKVRHLNWDRDAGKKFLTEKITRVRKGFIDDDRNECLEFGFCKPNTNNPVESFLGCTTIENTVRSVNEDILDYILRHTKNCPRELVSMCNALYAAIFEEKSKGATAISDDLIRLSVSNTAADIAAETLSVCANFIASSIFSLEYLNDAFDAKIPIIKKEVESKGDNKFHDFEYELTGIYQRLLEEAICSLGKDTFTYDEFFEAIKPYAELTEDAASTRYKMHKIQHVMWNQGLIGIREYAPNKSYSTDHFYTDSKIYQDLYLPKNRSTYVLHPGLIDYLNLQPVGDRPVGGGKFSYE